MKKQSVLVWTLMGSLVSFACGTEGQAGKAGENGANGSNGSDGHSSLVSIVDEPEGVHCAHGGKKIAIGLDSNKNGQLDPDEISSSTYVCNEVAGTPGKDGSDGKDGQPGTDGKDGIDGTPGADGHDGSPGQNGLNSLIRTAHEFAGANCTYGGVRIEVGLDANNNGVLEDTEVTTAATQFLCQQFPAYAELPALPVVTTVRGFALTASADDGSARLGFMFTDPTYRQSLLDAGSILNLGGVYDGPNVYAMYKLNNAAWQAYEGRTTPQTYSFSELVVADNASYYTTLYPSFGGLISALRNGDKGTYALTPAFSTRKAHSIAVPKGSSDLYGLIAQSGTTGLTFSRFPIAQFGVTYPNYWTNLAKLENSATTVSSPQLVVAGSTIAASYILGTSAVIRATTSPSTVAQASDLPVIGGCADAVLADIAWNGTYLYVACVDSLKVLTVKRASLTNLATVTFEPVATSIQGETDVIDLEASSTGVSLAIRQGSAVRVYANVSDALPAFDMVLPGTFDLARTAQGVTLATCDFSGDRKVRTFISR